MEKLKRLRQMPPEELKARLHERLRIHAERARARLGRVPQVEPAFDRMLAAAGIGSFVSYLRETAAPRFYPSAAGRDSFRAFVETNFSEWIEKAVEEAGPLCCHDVSLLGLGPVRLDTPIDWHSDPYTGREWPRRFWSAYNPVADCSDVKVVHELNRQQHLPRLAKTFFLTGDERYATEAIAQIDSWIAQNPPGIGINWQSALELAIRAISWIWTLLLLREARALDEAAARRIGAWLFAQLEHVAGYPSTYTSPNTHLLGEMAALFIAGAVFEEVGPARGWRDGSAAVLERELGRQVLPDGVYGEVSSYYHCYALDFYLQVLLLARHGSHQFPAGCWQALERMLEFVMHATRPDGTLPLIGDDDGGRALALHATHYGSFRDALGSGAVLFARGDFKYQSARFAEETAWLVGPASFDIYRQLPARPPADAHRAFPEAGYFVQRSGWSEKDSHLIFDCGHLGTLGGGHGHADALSFALWANGADLLIDPGTAVYNGAPEDREYFRSTRAHNTVTMDAREQCAPGGTFKWKTRAGARLLQRFSHAGLDYIEGSHDAYAAMGVVHRRRLLYCPPGYWVVADDFIGAGRHELTFHYHLPPGCEIGLRERQGPDINLYARNGSAAMLLFLHGAGHLAARIACGERHPVQGWASGRYGEKRPAPVLEATWSGPLPASFIAVLAPFDPETAGFPPGPRALEVAGGAIGCAIESAAFTDVVVASSPSTLVDLHDTRLRGEFFWLRSRRSQLQQVLAARATSLRYRDSALFDRAEPLACLSAVLSHDQAVIQCSGDQDKVYVRNLRNCEL